jgi:hypothetical protein
MISNKPFNNIPQCMKKILCPVDFHSDKLLHYLGDLAKDTESKIYLIATEPSKDKKLALANSENRVGRNTPLDEFHDYLSAFKHVACGIEEESISGNSYKKLGLIADNYDLMAMSISGKGIGNVKEGGLNVTKIMQETLVPILLIPDEFKYTKIKHLLYAYDYKHEPDPPLSQLHWLADWFEAEVKFVSVLPSDISIKEQDKLEVLNKSIGKSWRGKNKISFETIVYPDVPRCLDQYLSLRGEHDLLVLSINHQNMLQRLWHKSVVKGLLRYSKHPYLIIHKVLLC